MGTKVSKVRSHSPIRYDRGPVVNQNVETEKVVLEEVECSVCLETLKAPIRVLSCGHSFCHQCIEGLWDPNQTNR